MRRQCFITNYAKSRGIDLLDKHLIKRARKFSREAHRLICGQVPGKGRLLLNQSREDQLALERLDRWQNRFGVGGVKDQPGGFIALNIANAHQPWQQQAARRPPDECIAH